MQTSYVFTTLLAAAGLVAALPATPNATASCVPGKVVDYTVISGDTLTKVSQKFHSGICDIANLNKLANPNVLSIGEVLEVPTDVCNPDNTSCLSKPADGTCVDPSKGSTYTIKSGDTFFTVAQSFGLTTEALEDANPGVDPLLLQIGQVIKLPVC